MAPFVVRCLAVAVVAGGALTLSTPALAVPWRAIHGVTSARYQEWVGQCNSDGFRIAFVQGYQTGDGVQFAAIALKDGKGWAARHNLDGTANQAAFDDLVGRGFRCVSVSGYHDGATQRFATAYVKDEGERWDARVGLSSDDFQARFNELTGDGLRPTWIFGYGTPDGPRFATLFEAGRTGKWLARHGLDGAGYQAIFDRETPNGLRPLSVSGYATPDGVRFALVMVADSARWRARHNLTSADYQQEFNRAAEQGFRPTCISGYYDGRDVRYAAVWVENN